jgi:signal transduction histidine kinase
MQELNVDTLAELNKNLQDYAHNADEESAERERNRISREIHDISGYIFTNLIALMDAAGSMPEKNSYTLTDLISTAPGTGPGGLQETRQHSASSERRAAQTDSALAIHKIVSIFRTVAGSRRPGSRKPAAVSAQI